MDKMYSHKSKLHMVDKLHRAKTCFSIEAYKQITVVVTNMLTSIHCTWKELKSIIQEQFHIVEETEVTRLLVCFLGVLSQALRNLLLLQSWTVSQQCYIPHFLSLIIFLPRFGYCEQ